MKKAVILMCTLLAFAACSKKGVATKSKEPVINAQAVFTNHCSGCHGPDGKTGRAPDLSKCSLDKGGLVNIISNGEGHMPAFQSSLSPKEIEALSGFVLALRK